MSETDWIAAYLAGESPPRKPVPYEYIGDDADDAAPCGCIVRKLKKECRPVWPCPRAWALHDAIVGLMVTDRARVAELERTWDQHILAAVEAVGGSASFRGQARTAIQERQKQQRQERAQEAALRQVARDPVLNRPARVQKALQAGQQEMF